MLSLDFLNLEFMQRALLAGSLIAILCAIIGIFLVLRKFSLIGDGLAHVSFGSLALGLFFGIYPFYLAIPLVMLASLLVWKLTEKTKIYGDTAIGIVSALGIAGGVILSSVSQGFNIDLFSYLFGNILAIGPQEVIISLVLTAAALIIIIILFYKDLVSVAFDQEIAQVTGIKVGIINTIFFLLTGITVILAVKVVGVMLVSALLILPAVTALQLAKKFSRALVLAVACALVSIVIGITTSYFADLPAGATIVMINLGLFLIAFITKKIVK